jgi:hypothetical protein
MMATTTQYFMKKHPSLITIENLLRHIINRNIKEKKQSKANESLKTTDYPIHPILNYLIFTH